MSLSTSISNAFSGLTVTARAAQIVSSNLSNALNEDYSRREIEMSNLQQGGAKILRTNRFVDRALTSDLRYARADLALNNERAASAKSIAQSVGTPEDPNSLTAHLSRFDASLRYLESDPSSKVRQQETLFTAKALSEKLGAIESDIQRTRHGADRQISSTVSSLNSKLQKIVSLNREIVSAKLNGHDTSTWLDQRKRLVDEVSEIVPVRELRQANDAISLVSATGMVLVETSAVQFDFSKTNVIMPHMTVESGDLGTLHLGTDRIDIGAISGPMSGGRLQGLFDVRDRISGDAQDAVDSLALALASRFQDIPSDASLTPNAPGLFTDATVRVDSLNQTGLAGRLAVNTSVDPSKGGELWRLQGGLFATVKPAAGDSSIVGDMIDALSQSNSDGSILLKATELSSALSLNVSETEQSESFTRAQFEQLKALHLENGVNTDAELQKLLTIEKNYAANAKVLQIIDEMFSAILRIN